MKHKFFDLKRARSSSFFFLLLLACVILHPWSKGEFEIPRLGDISKREIIAPFTFYVLKSDSEFSREEAEIKAGVPEVVVKIDTISSLMLDSLTKLFNKTEEIRLATASFEKKRKAILDIWDELSNEQISILLTTRQFQVVRETLAELLKELYSVGIAPQELFTNSKSELYSINIGNAEYVYPIETLLDDTSAKTELKLKLDQTFADYKELGELSFRLGERFIHPNIFWDKEKTEIKRAEIAKTLTRQKGVVLKDERIVGSHEKVTPEIYEKLVSLKQALQSSNRTRSKEELYSVGIVVFLYALVIFMLFLFARVFRVELLENKTNLAIFALLILLGLIFSRIAQVIKLSPYIVPIPLLVIVSYFLFGFGIALALAISVSFLITIQLSFSFLDYFFVFSVGICSIYLFSKLKSRNEEYKYSSLLAFFSLIFGCALAMLDGESVRNIFIKGGTGFLSSIISPLLALAVLPPLERLIGRCTNFTLLEYSNANNPLLQRMMLEAPGTYSHSVAVATLAEAAAESIGANSLLARVGGYYHDIGKLAAPEYFDENLRGKSKHEKLSPHISYLILSRHVKDGVELARKNRFPIPIIDIIAEHHGTTIMDYFYQKALDEDNKTNSELFRYPGPRPRSKESAIVMLADEIEAYLRSLDEPSTSTIEEAVEKIVNRRIAEGELNQSRLTFNDVEMIKEKFKNLLFGIYHERTSYPEKKEVYKPDSDNETLYY